MLLDKDTIHLDTVSVYFWNIQESRKEMEELCCSIGIETSDIKDTKSNQRACEQLATRLIIAHRQGNNALLCHTDEGAPFIKNSTFHISISHSAHIVAVAFSSTPVGIDIEHKSEQVLRVREKFLNDRELANTDYNDKEMNMMFWTAKEAVYKIHGKKGIDFKNDIYQDSYNNTIFHAVGIREPASYAVTHFKFDNNFMLAIARQKM